MLKLVSWNCAHRPETWRSLVDSDADVALLQEACEPPPEIAARFDVDAEPWRTEGAGLKRPWRTAVVGLSNRVRLERIPARSIADAAPREFAVSRLGTVAAAHVEDPDTNGKYTLITVYAAWENPQESQGRIYADASAHRVISDISVLIGRQKGHRILVAGDLNILYGYGEGASSYWAGRYQTVFDRMRAIGVPFVGPQEPHGRLADPWPAELPRDSKNVPTYHTSHATPATAQRQMDFVFASTALAGQLSVRAWNEPEHWGCSDHCQVRIELGSPAG